MIMYKKLTERTIQHQCVSNELVGRYYGRNNHKLLPSKETNKFYFIYYNVNILKLVRTNTPRCV